MRSSHGKATVALALLAAALLAGCGGKYRGTANGGGGASPFVGAYTGTFVAAGGQDSGDIDFAVANGGTITGSVVVPTLAPNGQDVIQVTVNFAGTVTNAGGFTGQSTSITPTGAGIPTSVAFTGTIQRTATGASGTITRTANGGTPETESFVATLNSD